MCIFIKYKKKNNMQRNNQKIKIFKYWIRKSKNYSQDRNTNYKIIYSKFWYINEYLDLIIYMWDIPQKKKNG